MCDERKRLRHVVHVSAIVLMGLAMAGTAAGQRVEPADRARRSAAPALGRIASVEFVDTPITTIFKMISDLTGWSILVSPEVSKRPPKINMWIKDMSPAEVLDQVAVLASLVVQREGQIVKVMTFDEYGRLFGVEKRVIPLRYAMAKDIVRVLQPFMEKAEQSKIVADERANAIVLLVPKPLMESLERLVTALDVHLDRPDDTLQVVRLDHLEATTIAPALEQFLTQSAPGNRLDQAPGLTAGRKDPGEPKMGEEGSSEATTQPVAAGDIYRLRVMVEPKLNVIVLRGLAGDVAQAAGLLAQLDVPQGLIVRSYGLRYTGAQEIFQTLQQTLLAEAANSTARAGTTSRLRLALIAQNNRIVAVGSEADHRRVAQALQEIDQPLPPGTGGTRVYRLENATAAEVATVLQSLISSDGGTTPSRLPQRSVLTPPQDGIRRVRPTPVLETSDKAANSDVPASPVGGAPADAAAEASGDVLPAQVVPAPDINAVIIRASAAEHEEFGRLIQELDIPRDQVALEVTLVTVRSDRGFDLGLELSGARINDSGVQTIGFTNYGIGQVDPTTGALRIANPPPFGLNYAVFESDDYSLVLNALKTVGDTRITSAPKIITQDNSPAQISQVDQEPFETVNQGETTTTTSFGGFIDAGTVLTVTPHVAEDDWLRLLYSISLSSFRARTNLRLPPPRSESTIQGTVRLPGEHTVILGGLVGSRDDTTISGVPWLSDIPLVGELFKRRSEDNTHTTLFVFIRPIILRQRSFEDLLFLSRADRKKAGLAGQDYPINPLKMLPGDEAWEKVEP